MNIKEISDILKVGMEIEKPKKVTRIIRKTDKGITYSIGKENSKLVRYGQIEAAIDRIQSCGYIDRVWFKEKFPKSAKSAPCNFTTIGGILCKVGICKYNYDLKRYTLKMNMMI